MKGLVHGDDFLFTGTYKELQQLSKSFENEYACKIELIGLRKGHKRTARFLNRVITYSAKGVEFEGDQRLVEALVEGLGLEGGKPVSAPGTKPTPVTKGEHQKVMERRLGDQGGGDCVIANMKAEIGRLKKELSALQGNAARADLGTSHHEEGGAHYLGTTHQHDSELLSFSDQKPQEEDNWIKSWQGRPKAIINLRLLARTIYVLTAQT